MAYGYLRVGIRRLRCSRLRRKDADRASRRPGRLDEPSIAGHGVDATDAG